MALEAHIGMQGTRKTKRGPRVFPFLSPSAPPFGAHDLFAVQEAHSPVQAGKAPTSKGALLRNLGLVHHDSWSLVAYTVFAMSMFILFG